jgi:Raf kinase inhibitor-like YbhB/YbcL family protein
VTDPDAGGFVHWVVYGLPGSTIGLREGRLPQGARAGTNGFGDTGYGGPCPPPGDGAHRYVFTLYALDEPVGSGAGSHAVRAARRHRLLCEGEGQPQRDLRSQLRPPRGR